MLLSSVCTAYTLLHFHCISLYISIAFYFLVLFLIFWIPLVSVWVVGLLTMNLVCEDDGTSVWGLLSVTPCVLDVCCACVGFYHKFQPSNSVRLPDFAGFWLFYNKAVDMGFHQTQESTPRCCQRFRLTSVFGLHLTSGSVPVTAANAVVSCWV